MKATGLSRVSKEIIISEVEAELQKHPTFFIAQHGTLSATAMDKLRAKLRPSKSRYFVVKNSLGKRALEKAKLGHLSDKLTGACGIAFAGEDVVAPSKVLMEFSKENEVFKVQTGYFNGQVIGADQVKALASLPSKEVLLAKVLGGMQTPITKFVGVLSGTVRHVVTVLDAIAKKKAGS